MEVSTDFVSLKLAMMQRLWDLQDPIRLEQIRALLTDPEPTPQYILDLIDQRREAAKHQPGTPIEDFLKEIEDL
jgi:hypothetical protein